VNELNRQLTQAQTERIQQEAYLNMIEGGRAESLPQMRDNLILQDLSKRLSESRAQLAQALAVFGKNNPNVKKLQNQTDEFEAQLNAERQRVVGQVRTSYQAALTRERLLALALADMKGSVDSTNEKMVQYNLLKRNAQATSNLYLTLSNRLKEVAISGSLKSSNIRVLDQARVPDRPAKPHRFQIIALGTVLSVLGGVALAFVKESFDDTVYTPDDVKVWTGLPSLAMFPEIASRHTNRLGASARPAMLLGNNSKKLKDVSGLKFFLERPGSAEAEAVRSLDTSIRLSSRPGANPLRVILLASAFPNEGKTTVAVNLAIALAQHSSTCLLDADLRNPVVARSFGLSFKQGLQDVLTGSALVKDVLRSVPDVANLTILPAGPAPPPNPGELVASERMGEVLRGLRERFDHVVIDSPPIIPYADGRWLSSLSDGVVLVAPCGSTTRQAMIWSAEMLAEIHAPVLGVVLNGVDLDSGYYGYRYGHELYTHSST
jgi:capsular exopolysaccharide synthesis family protein